MHFSFSLLLLLRLCELEWRRTSVSLHWVFGFRSVQDKDHVNWAAEAGATFKNYKSNNPSYTKKYLVTKKQTNKQTMFIFLTTLADILQSLPQGELYLATAPASGNVEKLGLI